MEVLIDQDTNKQTSAQTNKNNSTPSNTSIEKKKIWTIQIMANPSIEVARKKQLELNQKGFDAYTEAWFSKEENKEYWRVRIGKFTDKETGQKVVKSLKELGYETWFTNFYQ